MYNEYRTPADWAGLIAAGISAFSGVAIIAYAVARATSNITMKIRARITNGNKARSYADL
jgi:hypothetical protein